MGNQGMQQEIITREYRAEDVQAVADIYNGGLHL